MTLESKWENLSPKVKRNAVIGTAFFAVSILFYFYITATGKDSKTTRQVTAPNKPEVTILMGKDTKDVGMDVLMAKINLLESTVADIKKKNSQSGNSVDTNISTTNLPYEGDSGVISLPGVLASGKNTTPAAQQKIQPLPLTNAKEPLVPLSQTLQQTPIGQQPVNQSAKANVKPYNEADSQPTIDLTPTQQGNTPDNHGSQTDTQQKASSKIKGFENDSAGSIDLSGNTVSDSSNGDTGAKTKTLFGKNTQKSASFYIPPGTIIQGTLITGVDAPTATNSKQEPLPALYRIKREAILPNFASMDISECFLLIAAYGDLSSERAYMRSENISCITNDNRVIDSKIDAYATGEDGKAGLRGRLVSKAGSVIAKATLASFLEAAAGVFTPSKVNALQINPQDTASYQLPDPSLALTQGVMGGASKTASMISQYYLQTANSLFPIIEVDAGRSVDFIVTKGSVITPKTSSEMAVAPVNAINSNAKNSGFGSNTKSSSPLSNLFTQQPNH